MTAAGQQRQLEELLPMALRLSMIKQQESGWVEAQRRLSLSLQPHLLEAPQLGSIRGLVQRSQHQEHHLFTTPTDPTELPLRRRLVGSLATLSLVATNRTEQT